MVFIVTHIVRSIVYTVVHMLQVFKRLYFPTVSFLAGFILMTLELSSSRVIAPMVGSSVYTWTTVIGITLLGLSIGSILGGYIADKPKAKLHTLYILLGSSITIAVIPLLADWLPGVVSFSMPIVILLVIVTSVLFLIPGILIGMIQPLVVKQYTTDMQHLGRHYGTLSGIWSIGSILGVFLTGLVLVSWLGTTTLMVVLALGMFVVALGWAFFVLDFVSVFKFVAFGAVALFVLISLAFSLGAHSENLVTIQDTNYYQAKVIEFEYRERPVRGLFLDVDSHSLETDVMYPDFYTSTYVLFREWFKKPENVLVIGGGAYTLPKSFAELYPATAIDVLEIDPQVTSVAEQYFSLGEYKNINTYFDDPRVFFKQGDKQYDIIFGDAYHSFISVPWHLVTKEAHQEVYEHLSEDGVYVLGFISSLTGKGQEFTGSMIQTFSSVFPHYEMMFFSDDSETVDTVLLFGFKNEPTHSVSQAAQRALQKHPELSLWSEYIYEAPVVTGDILTDDYTPTERLMQDVVQYYYPVYMDFYNNLFGFTS